MAAELKESQSVESIHARLRDAIVRGEIEPSAPLSQVQLARWLGVSRTPLREALRMLVGEGLLESEPNRGVRAAGYSIPDLEELYSVRVTLEALGIRLTIPRLGPEDVAELEGLMAQMAHHAQARDYERWAVPHRAFHVGLVKHSGARLVTTLMQLSDHAERYRRLYTTSQVPRGWLGGVAEHRAILDACKRGDVEGGVTALAAHLAHTAFGVIARIEPAYEPAALETALAALGVDHARVRAEAT